MKQLLRKMSQNSKENICDGAFLCKVAAGYRVARLLKMKSATDASL